jgi:signal transduction histidine kinase
MERSANPNGGKFPAAKVQDEQQIRIEEALPHALPEMPTQAILNAIPDAVFRYTMDGTLLYFHVPSPDWQLLLAADELVGSNIRDMRAPPEVIAQILEATSQASETGVLQTIEYSVGTSPGVFQSFEARVAPCGPGELVAIVRDVTRQKDGEKALEQQRRFLRRSEERMRALTSQLLTAQEEERRRIARELHDDITQKVVAIGLELHLFANNDAANRQRMSVLREQVMQLADQVRDLSHTFHPGVLEHAGLAAALTSHCAEVSRQSGIGVDFSARNLPDSIPHAVSVVLYRIAQEALRNLVKHSGATLATVVLARIKDTNGHSRLRLAVMDNGRGFVLDDAQPAQGLGLLSIEERARMVHGAAHISTELGEGTRVEVEVPLAENCA